VWEDTGQEEGLQAAAMGWAGDLIWVDVRRNACWLRASDVKRRQAR
jgi:hypothetical protein